jgi:hypothetical protein
MTRTAERDRRPRPSNNTNNSNYSADSRTSDRHHDSRSNNTANNRDGERYSSNNDSRISSTREGGRGNSGRPAWMDDESQSHSNSTSTPAWMDSATVPSISSTTAAADGPPVDGIQAWKAQMKEMERKEKAKDDELKGVAVQKEEARSEPPGLTPSSYTTTNGTTKSEDASAGEMRASNVFDKLLNGSASTASSGDSAIIMPISTSGTTPIPTPTTTTTAPEGRSSRFAKFFDGKPAATVQAISTDAKVTSSVNGVEASPADKESMNRLMGMLSGARPPSVDPLPSFSIPAPASIPAPITITPILIPAQPSPLLAPPVTEPVSTLRARGSSGGSRFAFSQPQPPSTASVASSSISSSINLDARSVTSPVPASQPITLSHAQILQLQQQQQLQHSLHQQHQLQQLQQQYPTNSAQQQLFLLQQQHFAAQQFNGNNNNQNNSQSSSAQSPQPQQPSPHQQQQQQQFPPHTRTSSYTSGTSPTLPQNSMSQAQQQGTSSRGPQFFPPSGNPSHLQQLQQQHLQLHGILPSNSNNGNGNSNNGGNSNVRSPMYAPSPYQQSPPTSATLPNSVSRPFAPPLPLPTSQQYPLGYPPPATSYQQLQQQRPADYGRVLPLPSQHQQQGNQQASSFSPIFYSLTFSYFLLDVVGNR